MKVFLHFSLIFSLILSACSGKKDSGLMTFVVIKGEYSESINIQGTVQAVQNYPVKPPRSMFGRRTIEKLAADGAYVKKGDTICIISVPELESQHQQIKTDIQTLEAELKKTEADNRLQIALLEAQLATCEAQLKISSLDSMKMQYATGSQRRLLELEIKKALIEKRKAEKKLAATRQIADLGIKQMNARIIQENTKGKAMEDQLNSLVITAPRDGMVTRTEGPRWWMMGPSGLTEIGGAIKEGSVLYGDTPVLQFPDFSRMQISADVEETDFKNIEKGQLVHIRVDAANNLFTTGKVNRKSLMGQTAEKYSDSKVKFYEIIIDVDSCHLKMKPGLGAKCEIFLQDIRDTLFVPTLALFERDSSKVVYVKESRKYVPVRVTTGLSGGSYTIITGGLKGGETIALSEPPFSLIVDKKVKTKTSEPLKQKTGNKTSL